MNKNLLVIIFFYVLSVSALMGQSEVTLSQDDEKVSTYWLNTVPFYSLPRIRVGKYYGSLLEIKIPRDTIRSTGGKILKVHVKQIRIINVEGIPEGLSYSPTIVDKDDQKYFSFFLELYGRTKSKTSSNIVAKMSVTFTLNNGKSLVRSFNIRNISLREDTRRNMETTGDNSIGLKSLKSYPNPINDVTEVSFWSSKLQLVEFEVRDAIGNLRFKQTFTAKMGSNKISFSQKDLPNGLYLYSIKNQDITLAKRLIIK